MNHSDESMKLNVVLIVFEINESSQQIFSNHINHLLALVSWCWLLNVSTFVERERERKGVRLQGVISAEKVTKSCFCYLMLLHSSTLSHL